MSYNKWGPPVEDRPTTYDEIAFNAAKRRNSGAAVNTPQIDEDGFGPSRYEMYMENKSNQVDENLTSKGMKSLSGTRQEQLNVVASREVHNPRANLGDVHLVTPKKLIKSASFGANQPVNITGKGSTTHIAPELYSPLFLTQNLQLPRERITANAWNRAFYETNPIIRNCINLHATYPISKLNIKCEDKKKEQFFLDMADRVDLTNVVQSASLEYWKLGEKIDGDTLITMADGSLKKITDVQIGDYVLTHLGNKKKVVDRWIKPTNTVVEDDLKIYEITVRGLDEPLIISGRHPIFSSSGKDIKCDTPSCQRKNMRILPGKTKCGNCNKKFVSSTSPNFIEPNYVDKGDLVYSPFSTDSVDIPEIDNDYAYVMGQWLAEGSYSKAPRKTYTKLNGIKFCSYDQDYIENKLSPLLKKVFGFSGNTYISKSTDFSIGKDKFDVILDGECRNGPSIANFFMEHLGEYSKTKCLSPSIMNLPVEKQLHLLAGFIDGDGCVGKNSVIICTSSKSLANQFRMILNRAGAKPTVSKQKSVCRGKETGNYNYRIKLVSNEAFDLFYGKLKSNKNSLLHKSSWTAPKTGIEKNWQVRDITNIKDITSSYFKKYMYDIAVEDDHSYVANGIAIHNCFVYSSFDESTGMWDKIYLHNPDYISVNASSIPGIETISLRPDPELERIIMSNEPAHAKIREQLDERVVHHVLQGEYIPLDSFNISHLKHLSSSYDVRGTSIIVSCWKDLMLYDKLRECFDKDTEILTRDGFKKYQDVIEIVNGQAVPKKEIEVACYNPDNQEMEFYEPISAVLKPYNGDMLHFNGQKMDVMVTPNHRMYASKKTKKGWQPYTDILAKDFSKGSFYKFKCDAGWTGDYFDDFIEIDDKEFPMDLYLKFLGYVVSEGCLHRRGYNSSISYSQATSSDCYEDMRDTFTKVSKIVGRTLSETTKVVGSGFSAYAPREMWEGRVSHRSFCEFLISEIGTNGRSKSIDKRLPRWVFNLPTSKLKILLDALVKADGSEIPSKYNSDSIGFRYSTVSKQLADDVYELAYRCGYVPNVVVSEKPYCKEFLVCWSNTNYGNEPNIYNNKKHGGGNIDKVPYNDYVWCLEVPTDLLIVRRNGKISIQHNCKFVQSDSMINPLTLIKVGSSNADGHYPRPEDLQVWREIIEEAQYDKDFKIVTHPDVSIERIGFNGQIVDTTNDFNMIIDNLLMGMMVPKAIITQEGATYASASVALDVMRQRYNNFRNMMANWLTQKIFAPIAEANDFYKYENGKKRLIVPEIEWNQMTLYDLDSYIGHLMALYDKQPRATSKKTLFRSLGLNVKDEDANIREESISNAIVEREKQELAKMSLSELRALDPETPLLESEDSPLPGMPGGPGGMSGPGGMPGDLGGGLPGLPDLGGPPLGGSDMGGGLSGLDSPMGPPGGSPPGGDLGGPPTGGGPGGI